MLCSSTISFFIIIIIIKSCLATCWEDPNGEHMMNINAQVFCGLGLVTFLVVHMEPRLAAV